VDHVVSQPLIRDRYGRANSIDDLIVQYIVDTILRDDDSPDRRESRLFFWRIGREKRLGRMMMMMDDDEPFQGGQAGWKWGWGNVGDCRLDERLPRLPSCLRSRVFDVRAMNERTRGVVCVCVCVCVCVVCAPEKASSFQGFCDFHKRTGEQPWNHPSIGQGVPAGATVIQLERKTRPDQTKPVQSSPASKTHTCIAESVTFVGPHGRGSSVSLAVVPMGVRHMLFCFFFEE
jgi:hypothetical protein